MLRAPVPMPPRIPHALLPATLLAASPARAAEPPSSAPRPEPPPASQPLWIETSPAAIAGPSAPRPTTPWLLRHAPTRNTFELGLAFGALFPATGHALIDAEILRDSQGMFYQRYERFAADFAVRLAYFPLPMFGLEVEGALAPTYTRELRERANLYGLRGQLIAQLTRWSATPYLVAGGGLLGTRGALGTDRDPAFHLGLGGKIFVDDHLVLRLELRDTLAEGVTAALVNHIELSIGLSLRLRPRARKPRGPPARTPPARVPARTARHATP